MLTTLDETSQTNTNQKKLNLEKSDVFQPVKIKKKFISTILK